MRSRQPAVRFARAAAILLLAACPAPADAPVPKDSPQPAIAPVPAASLPPADPVWWCACYARPGTPPIPATACRNDQHACERLEHKAERGGGDAIAPNSLTHRCREIHAEHPGDRLGARDRWQPGDRPGNWLSVGACLLPGPPDAPPAASSLLAGERLGELVLGQSAAHIIELLGPPDRRGAAELSKQTGAYTQAWRYADHGLELFFDALESKGPYTLARLRATAPCARRTARGSGIGDPYRAVKSAYMKERDPAIESDDLSFVAGSIHDRLVFTFDPETKLVTEIVFAP